MGLISKINHRIMWKLGGALLLLFVLVMFVIGYVFIQAKRSELDEAILDVAARQSRLSQQIAKDALLIYDGNVEAVTDLQNHALLFDDSLNALKNGGAIALDSSHSFEIPPLADNLQPAVTTIINTWTPQYIEIQTLVDESNEVIEVFTIQRDLINKSEPLLSTAEKLTSELTDNQGIPIQINKSGQLRMLSQRIAFLSSLLANGDTSVVPTLTGLINEFDQILADLRFGNASLQMDSIDDRSISTLVEVENAWSFVKEDATLLVENADNFQNSLDSIAHINQETELLLEVSEKLVIAITDDAQARTASLENMLIGVAILFTLILFAILIFIRQNIVVPVQQIAIASQQLAEGDINVTLPSETADEVGQMSVAFARMVNYFNEMAGNARNIADGDLRIAVSPRSEDDILGNALQQTVVNLRELIAKVQMSINQVTHSSQQVSNVTSQVGGASQQVSRAIVQVAQGAGEQAASIANANNSMDQITRAANGIARGAQEQAHAAHQTNNFVSEMVSVVNTVNGVANSVLQANNEMVSVANVGVDTIKASNEGMSRIRIKTLDTDEKVRIMAERAKKISEIVDAIDAIADKTDMLALNAAVEAARAGENGKGFAVVAEQVRKLSENAKNQTRKIGDLIEHVQESVNQVLSAIEVTTAEVDKGSELTNQTEQALTHILEASEKATKSVTEISVAITELKSKSDNVEDAINSVSAVIEENTAVAEELAAGSREVSDSMQNISSIAEENSASAEEVSASTEEMSAQVEEVVASAAELHHLASELADTIAKFRI